MKTEVEEKRCARCNGRSSKQWFKVNNLTVGLECKQEVESLAKSTGKKGEQLLEVVRDEYKSMMRQTTVTGMILIDMLDLKAMIDKNKITVDQFLACAKKRYRGDDAKKIVKALKEK